jgi:hypothetical protein
MKVTFPPLNPGARKLGAGVNSHRAPQEMLRRGATDHVSCANAESTSIRLDLKPAWNVTRDGAPPEGNASSEP